MRIPTELEVTMYAKGYASASMIAEKTRLSKSTITRNIATGTIESVRVGNVSFATIASVKEFMGPEAVDLLDLHNWDDILHAELRE